MACSRERRLQLARDDDRRTGLGNEIKIKARAPKANPAHASLDHDELSVASPQRRQIGRWDDRVFPIAPDPKARAARAVFDGKPGGGAIARLELRPHPCVARRQQRQGDRSSAGPPGVSAAERSATTLPHRSVPLARQFKLRFPAHETLRQKAPRGRRRLGEPRAGSGASRPPSLTSLPSTRATSSRSSTAAIAHGSRPASPQSARQGEAQPSAWPATPSQMPALAPRRANRWRRRCAARKSMLKALPASRPRSSTAV